jgi:hypothetical protein
MPFNFPSDPANGATFSFGSLSWQYNGYAWERYDTTPNEVYSINGITGAIGLSAGTDVEISITGKTFTIASPTVYGVSGAIYASNLATGLLHGGIISINAGNSAAFDITSGRGQIHASGSTFTADPLPLLQYVNWSAQTGITLNNLATADTTWLYIDSSGVINQRTEYYTDDQIENTIIIGQLVHPSRTYINLARTNPNVAYATDKQYEQFIRAFGPIKISGHTISPNGANLKLNRTSGRAFSLGRNWINNTDDPSVVSDGAYTNCIFFRYYRGATAGTFVTVPNQTVIDPTKIDDGTGILATVPGGKYTIQRLFYYPNTPTLLGVYYGRAQYTSLADAAANINLEEFTEIENTRTNAIFVAYLIVKSGATDLTNTSDALILQAGSFRSTTSGGGSVSLTLDDLTDVIITGPANYDLLTYVDGVTGWENRSISSLPLVRSFNGLCGAVVGVSSVNGMTGAVTNIFAAGATITNTNSSATWYPTFVGGTGATAFYIDAVTTPLSYVPSSGTINSRVFNGTFGSNTAKLEANTPSIFVQDPTDSVSVDPRSFLQTGVSTFLIGAAVGMTFESNQIQFTNSSISPTWAYTFPQSNGTTGQVLTTNGAGTLTWENASLVSFASSDVSLSDVNTAQNIFTSASDTISLKANTTYLMKGQYIIQSGTNTHITSVSFLYGGGVTASMSFSSLNLAAALGTVSRAQDMVHFDSIVGGSINSTSTSARNTIVLEGMVKTDATTGCTLTPQITFSAAPGGTNLTKFGSYISFTPVGTSTATSIGTWS